MAKVKFSAIVSEMRNKLNGSVFSRNRGGAYLRTKVTPVNPGTQAQVLARAKLSQFSQAWRGLTQAQRDAWNSVTNQWAGTDVFGDVVNPSGNALFNRLNINVSIAGGSMLTLPPSPQGADAVTELSVTAAEGTPAMSVTFLPAAVPASHVMFLESTPNMSPGISNASAAFRKIAVLDAAEASPYAALQDQTDKFGAPIAGQKIFVRAKLINMVTGEVSQRLVASTIVSA